MVKGRGKHFEVYLDKNPGAILATSKLRGGAIDTSALQKESRISGNGKRQTSFNLKYTWIKFEVQFIKSKRGKIGAKVGLLLSQSPYKRALNTSHVG